MVESHEHINKTYCVLKGRKIIGCLKYDQFVNGSAL